MSRDRFEILLRWRDEGETERVEASKGDLRRALRVFIRAYPSAPRAAEAQVMLGWSLFEAGQVDAAERAFTAGQAARRPAAKRSADAGLRAVQAWRADSR